MNGPLKNVMYSLRPVFKISENIELPQNMYHLRKIEAVGEPPSNDVLRGIQDKSTGGDALDLEQRWDRVLEQLQDLKAQLAEIKKSVQTIPNSKVVVPSKPKAVVPNRLQVLDGAVINANPNSPPYSLLLIRQLYNDAVNVNISSHVHSTLSEVCSDVTTQFAEAGPAANGTTKINLFLIWKEGLLDTQLVVNPWKEISILGEVNILRYLARLGLHGLNYDDDDISTIQIDSILDTSHRLLHARTAKEKTSITRNLNAKLGKNSYFGGIDINISDIAIWSAFKQTGLVSSQELTQNLAKWFARVDGALQ